MSLLIGATCTNVGNMTLPNYIDTGPIIRPTTFIFLPAVCKVVAFKHGGLGFISLYFWSEMTVTMAAVSITAFIYLSWSVIGTLKDDGGFIWPMGKSPVVLSNCTLIVSPSRLMNGFKAEYRWICISLNVWLIHSSSSCRVLGISFFSGEVPNRLSYMKSM